MKKILSILLLVTIFTITTKANVSSIVDSLSKNTKESITYIDTSSNFKMIYTDIKSNIQALSSALKVGAEHVYGILVKQQVVNSITWLIFSILCIICIIVFIKIVMLASKNNWDDDGTIGFVFVAGIGCIVFLIICLAHIDTIVTGFVNPEYGAIKEIINFVK